MKDYLIILAGSPRGGEETWNSMYKYVKEPLNADLAICCSDRWNQDTSLFKKANYVWTFKEMENYFTEYYEKNFDGTWMDYFNMGKDTGLYSSGSIHFVFKDIILRKYIEILKKYKYIIYTRFDQYHTDVHPRIVNDEILIPEGEDYSGICDRHAAFPSKYSRKFLGICEYISNSESLSSSRSFINCESTFEDHLEKEELIGKVKRYKRSQFTASLNGEHTNWRVAKYKIYFKQNLMMKYPTEFMQSISNKIDKYGFRSFFLLDKKLLLNYLYLRTRINLGKLKNLNS